LYSSANYLVRPTHSNWPLIVTGFIASKLNALFGSKS
jgi:hypothetical protein